MLSRKFIWQVNSIRQALSACQPHHPNRFYSSFDRLTDAELKKEQEEAKRVQNMIDDNKDARSKTQLRIAQERMERERAKFLHQEGVLEDAKRNPLSHNLDSYEAIQRRLERREAEDEYLVDERDAIDGEVTDSD